MGNSEITPCQDEMKKDYPSTGLDMVNGHNLTDHVSAEGTSLMKAESLESDLCLENPINNNGSEAVLTDVQCIEHPINNNSSDSVLTQAICIVEPKCNKKKRKRKKKSASLDIDACSEHQVITNSSESVVTEVPSNVESKHSNKNRNKKKKRQKTMDNALSDSVGDASSVKDSSTERDSCLESEVDVKTNLDLKIQVTEMSSSQKKRIRRKKQKEKQKQIHSAALTDDKGHVSLVVKESGLTDMGEHSLISEKQGGSPRTSTITMAEKHGSNCQDGHVSIEKESGKSYQREVELKTYNRKRIKSYDLPEYCVQSITLAGQTSLEMSNVSHSFDDLENNSENVQVREHTAPVKVVENVLDEMASNSSNGDFAFGESKVTETKSNAPIKEENIPELSFFPAQPPCIRQANKKLLILDVNGLLADIVAYSPYGYKADIIISKKSVFIRPFCDEFLQFCFEKFNVGVWSSRNKKNVDVLVDFLFRDSRHKLLFCWDQSHCTNTGFTTVENTSKPLVLKELKKLWENLSSDLPWNKGEYDASNTLLLDDSPYKALRNPVHTAIFPHSYLFREVRDSSLGPGGDLRLYLERLAEAENVQEFVAQNPFGQRAITESDPSWGFYRRIANVGQSQDVASTSITDSDCINNNLQNTSTS